MAIDFDGDNDIVNCGSPAILDNLTGAPFTAMVWFNARGWGDSNFGRMLCKTNTSGASGWFFFLDSGGVLRFYQAFSTNACDYETNAGTVVLGTTYHGAVTYNGVNTTNRPLLYLDGIEMNRNETDAPAGTIYDDASNNFTLGNRENMARSYDGLMWDARLYNRILRADEILSIYTARGKDANVNGMVGRWLMRGRGGAVPTTIADLSVNGNAGTVSGSPNLVTDLLGARSG